MFKKIFLVFILGILIIPSLALGAGSMESKIPELNPLCWQKSKCAEKRKEFFGIEDNKNVDSWCVKEAPCDGKIEGAENDYWCKCLPAGQTNTAIKIGGTNTFNNLGVYLLTIYDYALKIAGIVAVLVSIVAGVQWMTSGGNGSIIEAAKKRILGAFIGLFIAYGSYFILNTINPALVNLRLPQTWMIKPQELVPEFCSALPETTMFALAAKADNQKSTISGPMKGEKYQYSYKDARAQKPPKLDWFECGKRFVSKDGGSASCFGDYCKPGNFCGDFGITDKNKLHECKQGMIGGLITGALGISDKTELVDNNVALYAFCGDGDIEKIVSKDAYVVDAVEAYDIPYTKEIENACKKKPLGFFIAAQINDETGLTGRIIEGWDLSWGQDDWHAIGQVAPGSHSCSVNLAKKINSSKCGAKPELCSFFIFNKDPLAKLWEGIYMESGKNYYDKIKNNFISLDELKNGYSCNIYITREEFPAVDNP